MTNVAAWFLSLIGPLAKRVLISLGLGYVSYEGISLIMDQVRAAINLSYGALSGPLLQIVDMLGMGAAIGIILGGVAARAAFAATGKIAKLS